MKLLNINIKIDLFIIVLLFALMQSLQAQNKPDILIIDEKYDIPVPIFKIVRQISVHRVFFHKTKESLLQQCIDSTRYYGGNCFKVINYDDNGFVFTGIGQGFNDYIRGNIYNLDNREIQEIRKSIENYVPLKMNLR